jgi:hypothetical protein
MSMSPKAARLFAKIVRIGPSYFDAAVPLHEAQSRVLDEILRTRSVKKIRALQAEFTAISAQIDAIGETKQ